MFTLFILESLAHKYQVFVEKMGFSSEAVKVLPSHHRLIHIKKMWMRRRRISIDCSVTTSENCTCGPDSDIWSCQNIGRHRGSFTGQISTLSILLQMLPNFAWSFFYISRSNFSKKNGISTAKIIGISDTILHCNFVC